MLIGRDIRDPRGEVEGMADTYPSRIDRCHAKSSRFRKRHQPPSLPVGVYA
jgi:hypothetical protein